ncbi:MAG: sulfurtransferase-like selenium metabolism protein YedF [Lachnospiraceae bacterium]|nr:sulfurtransferase-like selenium metabolism protein YedF [Lachnospiraceae bacterium]
MITINAMGEVCPIPVVKARKALESLVGPEELEVLVDNEIAVQNLSKMAEQKGLPVQSKKLADDWFSVVISVPVDPDDKFANPSVLASAMTAAKLSRSAAAEINASGSMGTGGMGAGSAEGGSKGSGIAGAGSMGTGSAGTPGADASAASADTCIPEARKNTAVVISSRYMGSGDDQLGAVLMKSFIFSLTQLEVLPKTVIFYNGGVHLSCEGSESLQDLKSLEAMGTEIISCGTCLNHYGLTEKLQVGRVTNMYEIAETMLKASSIVKP